MCMHVRVLDELLSVQDRMMYKSQRDVFVYKYMWREKKKILNGVTINDEKRKAKQK